MSKHIIPKGEIRAKGLHVGLYRRSTFKKKAKFTPSCIYKIDPNYQGDIQKMWGVKFFSEGPLGDYSARFGWRNYRGRMDILAYVHDNGNVTKDNTEVLICSVEINEEFGMRLEWDDTKYFFTVYTRGHAFTKSVAKTHTHKWSFRQGFYFEYGPNGEFGAPHEMILHIKNSNLKNLIP